MNGARHGALAYATPALRDEWALWSNPAGLSRTTQFVFSGSVEHNKNLPGADRKAITITCPLLSGGVGVGINQFGNDTYNEHLIAVGFGHQLGIAALGIRVDLIQFRTSGNTFTLAGIAFGGIADIHERFSVGAWASNINQPKLPDGQMLPVRMVVGPLFRPVEGVLIVMAIEKDMTYDASCRAGLEYRIHKKFFARSGFRMFPSSAHFGIGFITSRLKVDYALQFNRANNYGHQLSLGAILSKRKQSRS